MKWVWWGLAAVGVIIIGIVMGFIVELRPTSETSSTSLAIQEVLLGTPVVPPGEGKTWQGSDKIAQQPNYETTDPLVLRVVSAASPEQQFSVSVRLLKENGAVETLSPGMITVTGGTSGYCCWTVPTPGKYKLQIFAGSQAPLVVPVTIVPARQNTSPLQIHG